MYGVHKNKITKISLKIINSLFHWHQWPRYLQNQIQQKTIGFMKVKTVSLCDVSICRNLYFKLQKVYKRCI